MEFKIKESLYKQSIDNFDFNERAKNVLKRNGLFTIENILDRQNELPKLRNCGNETVKHIKNVIINAQICALFNGKEGN